MNTKYYLKIMGVIIITSLSSIVALNFLMDPYLIFGVPVEHRPKHLVDMSYLTKSVQLIHDRSDTIIIGSSIVDAAFKLPGSMSEIYEREHFNQKKHELLSLIKSDVSIYNAGIRNGGLNDVYNYIQHAYKNNPNLKHIIIGMEWNFFTYVNRAGGTVPKTAAMGNTSIPLILYFNNLLSSHVTYDSLLTLFYRIKMAVHHPYLFSKYQDFDIVDEYKDFMRYFKNYYALFLAKTFHKYTARRIIYNDLEKNLIQGQTRQELASFLFSIWSLSALKVSYETSGPDAVLNPEAFALMQRIVDFAKSHGLTLDVYVSPQHGIYWEIARQYGFQSYIDEWLRRLAEITPYWEFSGKIDFSKNVDNYFDTDALHFNPEAAQIILPAIMQGRENIKTAGVHYVTPENVASVIAARHEAESAWYKQNTYMQSILSHPNFAQTIQIRGDLDKVVSTEYIPSYKSYNIIKFMGNFIALPINKAPYDFRLLFTDKSGPVISGNSLENIMEKIRQIPDKTPDAHKQATYAYQS